MENAAFQLSKDDLLMIHRLASRASALNLAIARFRRKIFGACLLGIRSEMVSLIPMFALWKKGILLESLGNGTHRTQWGVAVVKDLLTAEREGHHHAKEILRNHFIRSTGGNKGRDNNIHWGCLECRILHFMYSDMGGMVGTAVGYGQEMLRMEWPDLPPEKRPVVFTFYGEGAEQQGCIHEARNWIATSNFKWDMDEFILRYGENFVTPLLRELKVLRGFPGALIIERNNRSLFADDIDEYGRSDLVKRAFGYGDMVGVQINSDDVIPYYQECVKAIERAQQCVATLMVVDTYRGTGHNQDQIQYAGSINTRIDLSKAARIFGLFDKTRKDGSTPLEEKNLARFDDAWSKDPILHPHYLFDMKAADEALAKTILEGEEAKMIALAEEVLEEPPVTMEEDKKDRVVFPPIDWGTLPKEPSSPSLLSEGYNRTYARVIANLLRKDKRVTYFGEDVAAREGGVLGLTQRLIEEFGPERIWNAPISEEAMIQTAGGRALYGSKPIVEFQFGWFGKEAEKFLEVEAMMYYQKKLKFRNVAVFPCGIVHSGGSGQFHEYYVEGKLCMDDGLVVAFPSNAYDLTGLLYSLYYYDGPAALILEISAGNSSEFINFARNYATGETNPSVPLGVPSAEYTIPFSKAKAVRVGKDFTVVTYGAAAVSAAKNEADFLAKDEGIDAEVIDLRTVHPADFETIKKSVQKTGRLVIFQAASRGTGAGRYLKSELLEQEKCMEYLLSPKIEIIAAGMEGDLFIPTAEELLWARLPYCISEVSLTDEKGRSFKQKIHRSPKLASAIREGMRYK